MVNILGPLGVGDLEGKKKKMFGINYFLKKWMTSSKVAAATLEAKLPQATSKATLQLYIDFNYKY